MLDVREPSCCWQASRVGAFGPEGAGDCVPPAAGAAGESASNNPGASHATSADSPNTPVGKQDRKRFCAGDNRDDVGAGRRFGYKQLAADDREKVGRLADNNGNGDRLPEATRRSMQSFHSVHRMGPAARQIAKSDALSRCHQHSPT